MRTDPAICTHGPPITRSWDLQHVLIRAVNQILDWPIPENRTEADTSGHRRIPPPLHSDPTKYPLYSAYLGELVGSDSFILVAAGVPGHQRAFVWSTN